MSLIHAFPARRCGLTLFLVATVCPLAALHAQQSPADNPVLAFYEDDPHADDYIWTQEIPWNRTFDIRDYGGVADGNEVGDGVGVTDNVAAFHAAVDAAHAAGGGVVYIPAGVWYFADHIYLKPGVVVRGDTPTITDAHDPAFDPPTNLEFPRYFFDKTANGGAGTDNASAFKAIRVTDNASASNIGLVWLDVNRAAIQMSADGDGTRNRLVFGVRNNNVAEPQSDIPQLTVDVGGTEVPFQKPWQRFSYRFSRNIHVFAQENVLVANNRVNDKHYAVDRQLPGWESVQTDDFLMEGYVIQDTKKVFGSDATARVELQAQHEPVFSYTNHYAIYVRGGSGSVWGAAPWETPGLFRPGVTVRDNWVYSTMRVGYHLSGYGLKVLGNVKRDRPNKNMWIHPAGKTSVQGAQTFENRGLDISGSSILVEGNDFEVERHRVNGSKYFSTDGEGILVQECCGGTTLDDIVIRNNTVSAYIGIYKMPYTRNIEITGNTLSRNFTDAAYIMVDANKNGSQAPVFDVRVENNTFTAGGGINVTGKSGGGGIFIRDNTLSGGTISYPEGITTLSGNTGFGALNAATVGAVRDYPVLALEDPSSDGTLAADAQTTVRARVTGSFLNPTPASAAELPDVVLVEIYANSTLLASFTSNNPDPHAVAWLYEAPWTPAPGFYQLSAAGDRAGYSGPITSTEWFTVSNVVHLRATSQAVLDLYGDWRAFWFGDETDPEIIGDTADPDLDGMANLLEFGVGGDPLTPDPALSPALVRSASDVRFRFGLRDELGDTVAFRLLRSSDLETWEDVPPGEIATVDADGANLPAGVSLRELVLPTSAEDPLMLKIHLERVD